jgi:glycerol transport system permease protein
MMKKFKWMVPTIYIIFLMLPIYWLINMSFKTTSEIINTYSFLQIALGIWVM